MTLFNRRKWLNRVFIWIFIQENNKIQCTSQKSWPACRLAKLVLYNFGEECCRSTKQQALCDTGPGDTHKDGIGQQYAHGSRDIPPCCEKSLLWAHVLTSVLMAFRNPLCAHTTASYEYMKMKVRYNQSVYNHDNVGVHTVFIGKVKVANSPHSPVMRKY